MKRLLSCVGLVLGGLFAGAQARPNVFIAISDDQSWPHASAYGSKMVQTPHFDRVAEEGVLFTRAFAPSPGCSPSRAAFLTGRHPWQLEEAGTHASYFSPKYVTFPERLAEAGYAVGHVGKGWGPGNFEKLGWSHNPAGPRIPAKPDYVAGLAHFLRDVRQGEQPFCFWFGSSDPHRGFQKGSGLAKGKRLEDAEVPSFLPDTPEVRSDLLDYAFEVERFDEDLGRMLALLEQEGALENTIVIVTSDNGCPFPRAKANCYEFGIHLPLAVRWGAKIPGGRVIEDTVGLVDLTATLYDFTRVPPPQRYPMAGESLGGWLVSAASGLIDPKRDGVFSGRERHSSSRFRSLGYPQRSLRTREFLYIRNFTPERWPAGPARKYARAVYGEDGQLVEGRLGPEHGGYHDIDACPTLSHLIEGRDDDAMRHYLELAVGKRPQEELYAVEDDPGCLHNLAPLPAHEATLKQLRERLTTYLKRGGDPRVTGDGNVWETYPRVSGLRWFPQPEWFRSARVEAPEQPWLEQRRPR